MRFFRLPRPNGRKAASFLTWPRVRSYLAGLLVLVLAFIAGLYLFFPTRALKERAEREFSARTGTPLHIGRLHLAFPPAFVAREVRIAGSRDFDIASLRLRPLWLTLFGQSPGVEFDMNLLGGEISGAARRNGPVAINASQLAFAEQLPGSNFELAGVLGNGSFAGVLPPAAASESRFELRLDSLLLNGLESLGVADGSLTLGRVVGRGEGRGNNFRIEELEATGGELLVSGTGSLLLAQPIGQSRLNLTLTLRPGAGMDPNLRDLLDLFATPGRSGGYVLRLSGTLATPVFAK